ncbi:MAG: hypothetical protein FWH48_09010 [Oscillospiraceae bacterium]|nr:hypothetical protein [Oscillospiraceae bacterium]
MTKKERLWAVYKGETPDRMPVKLWGLSKNQPMLRPIYKSVYDAALEKTDLIGGAGSAFDIFSGTKTKNLYESRTEPYNEDWTSHISVMHTPKGELKSVFLANNKGDPGLTKEYYVKNENDLKKILSLEYEPYPIDLKGYENALGSMGDDGLVMFGISHPAYMLQILTGSETLGYLLYDAPKLVEEVISLFAKRVYDHVKSLIEAGIAEFGPFAISYVGPELLIPPLVSFDIFEKFVYDMDKPYLDLIKNAGGHVWVHCHGKVKKIISRFADMGVDVLNPIEPPPMGDCTIEQALSEANGRITLEGNIEINDLHNQNGEYVRSFLENTVKKAHEHSDNRFILCPSTGYMEFVNPSQRYIDNLLTYVNYGLELAKKYER